MTVQKTARFRTRGSFQPYTYSGVEVYNSSTCAVVPTNGSMIDAIGKVETMYDYVTHDFDRLSEAGVIVNSPMTYTSSQRNIFDVGGWGYKHKTNCTRYEGEGPRAAQNISGIWDHLATPTIDIDNLRRLAGSEAAANVDVPDFNSLVTAAELKKTLAYLRNPLQNIVRELDRIARKRRKQKALKKIETFAEYLSREWLSLRYGLAPLMYDAQDAVEAAARIQDPYLLRRTARGYASVSDEASDVTAHPGDSVWAYNRIRQTVRTVEVRAGILYRPSSSFQRTLGLELGDIPGAIWELTPYSVIADWFANLDDVINGLVPEVGIVYLSKWTSVKTTTRTASMIYATTRKLSTSTWQYLRDPRAAVLHEQIEKQRLPGVSFGLGYDPRPFTGDVGKKRVLDLLALIKLGFNNKIPQRLRV